MKYRRYRRNVRRKKSVVLRSKIKKERAKALKSISLFFLILGFVGVSGYWIWNQSLDFIFNTDHFNIRQIEFKGLEDVTKTEIMALLPFRTGDNMFRLLLSRTEKSLKQCKPELKRVNISRRWQKIVVEIEERIPIACQYTDGKRFGLDEDNKLFPLKGKWIDKSLSEVVNTEESERKKVLKFIKIFRSEAEDLSSQIVSYKLVSINDIVMEFENGTKIFWGPIQKGRVRDKLERLNQVIKDAHVRYKELEYINLCFFDEGRILVKPKNHKSIVKRN